MEYITLGKTGLKISRLGFGGIPIQRVDAVTTKELVQSMVEKGINYIIFICKGINNRKPDIMSRALILLLRISKSYNYKHLYLPLINS